MVTHYFTKSQCAQLPQLYATEHVPLEDKLIVAKLFHPASNWTWYVIEYDGSDMCWGMVEGHELEYGYFSLNELRQLIGPYGLCIERDRYFKPCKVAELLQTIKVF